MQKTVPKILAKELYKFCILILLSYSNIILNYVLASSMPSQQPPVLYLALKFCCAELSRKRTASPLWRNLCWPNWKLGVKLSSDLLKVPMKRKLSLSYLKEVLKWQSNILCSFSLSRSCFVFQIFQFVWYAN